MGNGPQNHGRFAKIVGTAISKRFSGDKRKKKIQNIENEYKNNGGKTYVATYFGRDVTLTKSIIYPKEWFDNPTYLTFEGMKVPCPGDPFKYCELQYGNTYMQLPPEAVSYTHLDVYKRQQKICSGKSKDAGRKNRIVRACDGEGRAETTGRGEKLKAGNRKSEARIERRNVEAGSPGRELAQE